MTVELADGLARKLALKPGMKSRVIDPPAGYAPALAASLPDVAQASLPEDSWVDAVLAFATIMADLVRVAPDASAAVHRDGPRWIGYPKGASGVATDLTRDVVPPVVSPLGFRPVAQIAIDRAWSALRFRPAAAVGR